MTAQSNLAHALGRADQPSAANVFLTRGAESALEFARLIDASPAADLVLAGQVVIIKGNIDIEGLSTTAGTRTFSAKPATGSAPLVQQIASAGGVPLGHANMSEYAFSGLGLNPHFGTPANGLDASLVPGGSSSGCASAVAMGIADLAIGSDTSGSTRVPAAYQGIYGFRPTMGRYCDAGILPLAPSLDTPGPLAHDMAGIRALDAAICNQTPLVENLGRPRIVIPDEDSLGPLAPEIAALLPIAQRALKTAGYSVASIPIPVFSQVRNSFEREGTLAAAEAPDVLARFAPLNHRDMDPNVRRRIAQGMSIDPGKLTRLRALRIRAQRAMTSLLGDALLLMPTVPKLPPTLASVQNDAEQFAFENAKALSLTMLSAFLDLPSLAMPVAGRVPGQSLMLCATTGCDDAMLSAADDIAQLLLSLEIRVFA